MILYLSNDDITMLGMDPDQDMQNHDVGLIDVNIASMPESSLLS